MKIVFCCCFFFLSSFTYRLCPLLAPRKKKILVLWLPGSPSKQYTSVLTAMSCLFYKSKNQTLAACQTARDIIAGSAQGHRYSWRPLNPLRTVTAHISFPCVNLYFLVYTWHHLNKIMYTSTIHCNVMESNNKSKQKIRIFISKPYVY